MAPIPNPWCTTSLKNYPVDHSSVNREHATAVHVNEISDEEEFRAVMKTIRNGRADDDRWYQDTGREHQGLAVACQTAGESKTI